MSSPARSMRCSSGRGGRWSTWPTTGSTTIPHQYVDHIYGEHEVGGTGWLYLSAVPFDQIGFRTDLGHESVPELTQSFLYAVPVVFLLWPAFLTSRLRRNDERLRAK